MSLPNAKILIHQVSSGFEGQATDIEIDAREIIDTRSGSTRSSPSTPGRSSTRSPSDTERDYFMSAEEATEYGLIDRVIQAGE